MNRTQEYSEPDPFPVNRRNYSPGRFAINCSKTLITMNKPGTTDKVCFSISRSWFDQYEPFVTSTHTQNGCWKRRKRSLQGLLFRGWSTISHLDEFQYFISKLIRFHTFQCARYTEDAHLPKEKVQHSKVFEEAEKSRGFQQQNPGIEVLKMTRKKIHFSNKIRKKLGSNKCFELDLIK